MKHWDRHPGVRTGDQLSFSERAADAVPRWMGSWAFVVVQTVIVTVWIVLNLVGWMRHWDPYPFILLNLAFSTEAAYATPFILLAQHRQDVRAAEVANHTHDNTTTAAATLAQLSVDVRQMSVDVQRLWATLAEHVPQLGLGPVPRCAD